MQCTWTKMPNFQMNRQNRHLKVLNDRSHEMYNNYTIHQNSVKCFRSCWPSKIIFAQSWWPPPQNCPTKQKSRGARVPQAITTCKSAKHIATCLFKFSWKEVCTVVDYLYIKNDWFLGDQINTLPTVRCQARATMIRYTTLRVCASPPWKNCIT